MRIKLFSGPIGSLLLLLLSLAIRPGYSFHHENPQQQAVLDGHKAVQTLGGAWPSSAEALVSFDVLDELRRALDVMQRTWFRLWVGKWPTAIDWTAAVVDTHLVASLATFSKALNHAAREDDLDTAEQLSNELNRYFGQNIAYYFGEEAFSIRFQAYDDMLWVVLGWLESVKSIKLHSSLHYRPVVSSESQAWHGSQFIEAFAHRARVFYDLAAPGWDTKLCGGGMVWSPHLGPYKNAITNELFISASVGMYLYFPGDEIDSPFLTDFASSNDSRSILPQNPTYLQAAIDGYDWLANVGMRNRKGLYIDGFHITDWKGNGTKCDIRDTQIYTYNQGVVLSGLRGLWESTGNVTYLTDGHELVRNVIRATGWLLEDAKPPKSTEWAGIGRAGIMEERCDASGRCDQTPQSFKGIFFHHLTLFCEPLPTTPLVPGKTFVAEKSLRNLHRQSCREYGPWIAHNARAALETRDVKGRFGTWWGVNTGDDYVEPLDENAIDYRNNVSELDNELWRPLEPISEREHRSFVGSKDGDYLLAVHVSSSSSETTDSSSSSGPSDPNDRGKGRTVETQGGGVAVLRALWEILNLA